MTDNVISTKLRILTPDDGMALTDGSTYTTGSVYLAHSADASKWREIPEGDVPPQDQRPNPPRRWSRLTVKGALADARLLPAARTFLAAYEIKPDYPALEAFSDCNYIEEFYGGEDKWNQLLDSAAQALGMTRVEVDAFLDSLPTE